MTVTAQAPTCEGLAPGVPGDPTLLAAVEVLRSGRVPAAELALALVEESALPPLDHAHQVRAGVEARLARGDLDGAAEVAADLDARPWSDPDVLAVSEGTRALVSLAQGRLDDAVVHGARAGELLPAAHPDWLPWRADLAVTMLRQGRSGPASRLAHEHEEHARRWGSPLALAHALRTRALVCLGGERLTLLEAALQAAAAADARRLHAQVAVDLAGLLLLTGNDHHRAVDLLRTAERWAGQQDLRPLLHRAQRLLERAGEKPRRVRADTLAALTAAERRVAVLTASGLANRDVAEELVISVKAVEWHLSRVYRKLGIGSRRELTEALALG